ncbi:MAG: hypothetical protein R3349_03500 [Geminicoccaceae bacterium]|nr:hypothetical protein [Geminicoccaceae bacterium]
MPSLLDGRPAEGAPDWGGQDQAGTGPLAMTLIVAGFVLVWLAAIVLAARLMMLPAEASGRLFVVFPPGTAEDEAWRAIIDAGGRPVGAALGSWSWEAYADERGFAGRLDEQGALVSFRTSPLGIPLAGCLGVAKTPAQRPGFSPGL